MKAMSMTSARNTIAESKESSTKKVIKYLLIATPSVISIIFLLNAIWIMSGSNQWELEIDEGGTRIYSLKSPGSNVVKFKGVTRYNYSLSHMIAPFNDESLTVNCEEFMPGCVDYKFVKSWDSQSMSNVQYWRFDMPFPLADREIVLKGTLVQDPETKEVLLENMAAPNMVPPNDCCVRVTHMYNTWRYTPLKNGGLEVEFIQDFDQGGFFPGFLLSLGASQVHKVLHSEIPRLMDSSEQYRTAKLDYIAEY